MTRFLATIRAAYDNDGQPQAHLRCRRFLVVLIGLYVGLWAFAPAGTDAAAADRPTQFMRQVAKELVTAAKARSAQALLEVIRRHGDVPDIGLYSLGDYMERLPDHRRSAYYDGVARFMARYFLNQAKQYPVAEVQVHGPSSSDEWGHKVDSTVTLKTGDTYNVRWLVVPRGNGFKVRDVRIMGFWMTPFQRRLFENYIEENGGSVKALLAALGS